MQENPLQQQKVKAVDSSQAKAKAADDDSKFVTVNPNGKYDVCLVFPVDPTNGNKFSKEGLDILVKLTNGIGQSNILMYYSVDKEEIFVLVRVFKERLMNYADHKNITLRLDENGLINRAAKGWPSDDPLKHIKPLELASDRIDITRYRPFEYIYGEYKEAPEFQDLYFVPPGEDSPFTNNIRVDIVKRIIEEPEEENGLNIKLRELQKQPKDKTKKPVLLAVFPLHDYAKLDALSAEWFAFRNFLPWNQPFQSIMEYFGAKISLYFAFLGHMSWWLIFPALLGLLFQLVVIGTNNVASPVIPFYSLFIVLWGVLMLEFWKRKESYTALKFGMTDFERKETYRAEFEWDEKINLTGEEILYFAPEKRTRLVFESFSIIGSLCLAVVGTTASIYLIRYVLYGTAVEVGASYIASILNTIQIMVFNAIYASMSEYLTDRENHRTDTSYEDSMIAKNFMFQFINSYASFFYLAFFATSLPNPRDDDVNVGQCGYPTCMSALAINLGIILFTRLTVNNVMEVATPYLKIFFRTRDETKSLTAGQEVSAAESEFFREKYTSNDIIDDYMEIAIQFGYMTLFVSALPGAVFITLLFMFVEFRSDAYKMVALKQRPFPMGAEDIGTWQTIFELVIVAAVITNSALIVFTMQLLNHYSIQFRFWIFVGFQWVLFSLQYALAALVVDLPLDVDIQLQRQEFINRKLLKLEADDNFDVITDAEETNRESFNLLASVKEDFPSNLKAR